MAKNISLLGADYPNVPAVQLPQTGGGTATFYDIGFDIITVTVDCTNALMYDMAGSYSGALDLTDEQKSTARALIPLWARKSGYAGVISCGIENGTVRVTYDKSIAGVTVGILRIF